MKKEKNIFGIFATQHFTRNTDPSYIQNDMSEKNM